MAFDWIKFLERHRVHYVTRGPNVGRGDVAVKCPFCGQADPSEHMAISTRGSGWHCWRNPAHKGKRRARLIQALLGCSPQRAAELAEEGSAPEPPTDEDFGGLVAANLSGGQLTPPTRPAELKFPSGVRSLASKSPLVRPFRDYLRGRGYTDSQIDWLVAVYGLQYATTGKWRYRLIIPIRDEYNRLVSWTARSIVAHEPIRYKTLTTNAGWDDDEPRAICAPGQTLLGLPLLLGAREARALVVCEGPFDALRVSALGHNRGVYGTCLFGLNVSDEQVGLLMRLARQFAQVWLCVDTDAQLISTRIQDQLLPVRVRNARLPVGVKDPGELNEAQASQMMECWLT